VFLAIGSKSESTPQAQVTPMTSATNQQLGDQYMVNGSQPHAQYAAYGPQIGHLNMGYGPQASDPNIAISNAVNSAVPGQ